MEMQLNFWLCGQNNRHLGKITHPLKLFTHPDAVLCGAAAGRCGPRRHLAPHTLHRTLVMLPRRLQHQLTQDLEGRLLLLAVRQGQGLSIHGDDVPAG